MKIKNAFIKNNYKFLQIEDEQNKREFTVVSDSDNYYFYPSMTPVDFLIPDTKTVLWEDISNASDNLILNNFKKTPQDTIVDMDNVMVVSATAKDSHEQTLMYESSIALYPHKTRKNGIIYDIDFKMFLSNSTGLSTLYNSFLIEENRDKIIVFVHDDVLIEDLFFLSKLKDAHNHYDVVGIAGCVSPVIKSPAYWHLMAPRQNLRGYCAHMIKNSEQINMTSFGNSFTSVDLIDGVFMSVKVSSLLDSKVKFDEDFDFHFYDLAFSRRVVKSGLKLGVYPFNIRHASGGGGNQRWKDLEPLFINKYSS